MPQLATFYIGTEVFGINILLAREIGKSVEITPVPQAPEHILGLINLRGQILTIMEPRFFLSDTHIASTLLKERKLIIFKTEGELSTLKKHGLLSEKTYIKDPLAIVIDEIGDVVNIDATEISQPPPNLSGVKREYISGVYQRKEGLVILLDLNRLVQAALPPSDSESEEIQSVGS